MLRGGDGAGEVDQGVRAAGARLRAVLGDAAAGPGTRPPQPGGRRQLRARAHVHDTQARHRRRITRAPRWPALSQFRRHDQRDVPAV